MVKVLVKDPELPGRTWAIQIPGCALVADLVVGLLRKRGGDVSRPCLMRIYTDQQCITDAMAMQQSVRSLKLEGKLLRSSWAVAPGHLADKCSRCQQLLARASGGDSSTAETSITGASSGAVIASSLPNPSAPCLSHSTVFLSHSSSAESIYPPAIRESNHASDRRLSSTTTTSGYQLSRGVRRTGEAEVAAATSPPCMKESSSTGHSWETAASSFRTLAESTLDPELNSDPARRPQNTDEKVSRPQLGASSAVLESVVKTPRQVRSQREPLATPLTHDRDNSNHDAASRLVPLKPTQSVSLGCASAEPLDCIVDRLERLARLRSSLELSPEEYTLAKDIVLRQAQQQQFSLP